MTICDNWFGESPMGEPSRTTIAEPPNQLFLCGSGGSRTSSKNQRFRGSPYLIGTGTENHPTQKTESAAPMTTMITVLRDRFVAGAALSGAVTAPLGEALRRRFANDAHFTAYSSPLGCRLTRAHVGTVPIALGWLVFDVDAPGHTATPEWRAELSAKLEALEAVHPGFFSYETRGGARLIWCLSRPFEISSEADASEWSVRYGLACDELARFRIEADRSCADWQRLYRLPFVTRDGAKQDPAIVGDAAAIGAFELPEVSAHQRARIARNCNVLSPAAGRVHALGEERDRGVLFELLDARGDVLRELRPGVWVVRCPNEREHTSGTTGDTSTLLFESNTLAGPGAIYCQHAHCRKIRTARQWKREIAKRDAPPLRGGGDVLQVCRQGGSL